MDFGANTKDEIWKIFMWSATCLKNGQYPDKRHDGSAWLKSDKQRRQMQGCLPAKGILCEIRADWDWFNQFLQLPTFNTKSGMCWMCNCTYENFKAQNAAQRACLKTKAEFLTNLANMKKQCHLFGNGLGILLFFVALIGCILLTKELGQT